MASAPQAWMGLVTAEWKTALSDAGFRKRGHLFCRHHEDAVWVIQAQSSSFSSALGLKMTVNLGVHIPALHHVLAYYDRPAPAWPTPPECQFRERLGFLMPEHTDRWWTVATDQAATALGRELAQLLLHYGLPALQPVGTAARLRIYWESGRSNGITKFLAERYLAALGGSAQ